MKPNRASIDELASLYRHEERHAAHVTALALHLFDATHRRLKIPAAERRLLEAACRLHDIGFTDTPADHARQGARVVREQGLRGFVNTQRAAVAHAILQHAGATMQAASRSGGLLPAARRRALRLAAYLRIADGLDHAHVQNASIRSVRLRGSRFVVSVCSPGYPGNVPWADRKADLWRDVFPVGIEFRMLPSRPHPPIFHGVLAPGDSLADAAHKLLSLQYRCISDSRIAALEAADAEALHDLRVAMRRFRAALRLFRKPLAGTAAAKLDARFAALAARLSPLRDVEVWLAFLEVPEATKALVSTHRGAAYRDRLHLQERRARSNLTRTLRAKACTRLLHDTARFIRIELSDCPALRECGDAAPYLSRRTGRLVEKILRSGKLRRDASPEQAHTLRKRVRRARYWTEFAAPILGTETHDLAARLALLATHLGDLHDMHVHLERIGKDRHRGARDLQRFLQKRATVYAMKYRKGWKELRKCPLPTFISR